jgi:hypothetical protein
MARHMIDLPHEPDFAIFGLGSDYDGYRWLTLWNSPDRLYTVSLGHGHPEARVGIGVTTVSKTPERVVEDGSLTSIGPTGFHDAMMDAVLSLAGLAHPDDRAAQMMFIEQGGAGAEPGAGQSDLSPAWAPGTTHVDGQPQASWHRELNGAWAVLIDLPTASISMTGTPGVTQPSGLETVSASAYL